MPEKITDSVSLARRGVKELAIEVKALMKHEQLIAEDLPETADAGEMRANVMLAYRHLEDAAMRLGKVLQAYDGGTSVYDK